MENNTVKAELDIATDDPEKVTEVSVDLYRKARAAGFKVRLDDPGVNDWPTLFITGPKSDVEAWILTNYDPEYDMELLEEAD